jgi:hypothetical protein
MNLIELNQSKAEPESAGLFEVVTAHVRNPQ